MLVIDGRLSFISGGDLGADRWDTCDHLDQDPNRRLPWGERYPARHDVAMMAEGPVAQSAAELFVERWANSGGGDLPMPEMAERSPWPEDFAADLVGVDVALTRTQPRWKHLPETQEGYRLHLECIARARRTIFLENQYLASPMIVEALCARLEEPDGPEVIAIGPSARPGLHAGEAGTPKHGVHQGQHRRTRRRGRRRRGLRACRAQHPDGHLREGRPGHQDVAVRRLCYVNCGVHPAQPREACRVDVLRGGRAHGAGREGRRGGVGR